MGRARRLGVWLDWHAKARRLVSLQIASCRRQCSACHACKRGRAGGCSPCCASSVLGDRAISSTTDMPSTANALRAPTTTASADATETRPACLEVVLSATETPYGQEVGNQLVRTLAFGMQILARMRCGGRPCAAQPPRRAVVRLLSQSRAVGLAPDGPLQGTHGTSPQDLRDTPECSCRTWSRVPDEAAAQIDN